MVVSEEVPEEGFVTTVALGLAAALGIKVAVADSVARRRRTLRQDQEVGAVEVMVAVRIVVELGAIVNLLGLGIATVIVTGATETAMAIVETVIETAIGTATVIASAKDTAAERTKDERDTTKTTHTMIPVPSGDTKSPLLTDGFCQS